MEHKRLLPRLPLAALVLLATTPLAAHAQDAAPNTAPAASTPATAPKAYDPKAEALLQRATDRLLAAQSYSAQIETTHNDPATETKPALTQRTLKTFRVQKPTLVYNEVRKEKQGRDGRWIILPRVTYRSDGEKAVALYLTTKVYNILPITKEALENAYALDCLAFFGLGTTDAQEARDLKACGSLVSLTLAPDAVWGGVPCFVVEQRSISYKDATPVSAANPADMDVARIYIGKKDGLLRGYHQEWAAQGDQKGIATQDDVITNVVVNQVLPASSFAVDVTGYKPRLKQPAPRQSASGTRR